MFQVLELLLERYLTVSSLPDDMVCLILTPSLLGLAQALSGNHVSRRKALQASLISNDEPTSTTGEWTGQLLFSDKHVEKIVTLVSSQLQ